MAEKRPVEDTADAPAPKKIYQRYRGWCLTINNPDVTKYPETLENLFSKEDMEYIVAQLEEGKEKTPHIQMYLHFQNQKAFSTVKKLFPTAHIEKARGSPEQNKVYCTKEEGRLQGPWEYGECPMQGKRNDLAQLKEDLDKGMQMKEVSEKHFNSFLRYPRGLLAYQLLHAPERDWQMVVQVFWGPTGSGKSSRARRENPGAYWKSRNAGSSQYFDNYNGQDTIIMDEFRGWLQFDSLLRILDSTPHQLDIKHGAVAMSARKVVFTSNDHPSEWYHLTRFPWNSQNPLLRRIGNDNIIYIGNEEYPHPEEYLRMREEENQRERRLFSEKSQRQ